MIFSPGDSDRWLASHLPLEKFGSSGKGLSQYCPLITPVIQKLQSRATKIITIAGTNGKGETCHRLSYLIKRKLIGKNHARWTSPHLFSVRERFSYNENNIDDQKLLALFKVHQHLAPELSYYEFLFYIFCQWIEELPLDFLILEVGLGGRLDCVNCFDADIAAITSISRDHTEYLGDNLEQILTEKLGVSRRNRPLLSTVYQPELRTKLREFEREKAYQLKDLFELGVISNKDTFSHTNQKLASELFTLLNGNTVEDEDWDDFLPGVGRGRVINTRWGSILAMGSHNAEGLLALESWLEWRVEKDFDGIFVGLSKRPTRDLSQCIKIIFETLKKRTVQLQLVGFDHPKAAPWSLMENALSEDSHLKREFDQSYCDFESWWELFEEKDNPKAQYLLTGSYYFIATVFNALDRAGVLIQ